jgi:hypothetical protein
MSTFIPPPYYGRVPGGAEEDRIVVRPESGSGADALKTASAIYEHARPAAASARIVQVIPKPAVVRR